MSIFGTLVFGAILAGSAIKAGIDNAKSMSKPRYYWKNGTPIYFDRFGHQWTNGERIVEKYDIHRKSTLYVGAKSGKVYRDTQKEYLDEREREAEESKKVALKYGKLAYVCYHPKAKDYRLREISTGKFIYEVSTDGYLPYEKVYANENMQYHFEFAPRNRKESTVIIDEKEARGLYLGDLKDLYYDGKMSEDEYNRLGVAKFIGVTSPYYFCHFKATRYKPNVRQ